MSYEVEIKAHASESLKRRIDNYLNSEGKRVYKDDIYFSYQESKIASFRIREESDSLIITVKRNNRDNGLEINEEVEVEHPKADKDKLIKMANMLGYNILFTKHKEGYEWMCDNIHIELLNVKSLGWFIEMEAISSYDSKYDNKEIIDKLYKLLDDFKVSRDMIESRSYQEMLESKK